jgi:hypothetical protein
MVSRCLNNFFFVSVIIRTVSHYVGTLVRTYTHISRRRDWRFRPQPPAEARSQSTPLVSSTVESTLAIDAYILCTTQQNRTSKERQATEAHETANSGSALKTTVSVWSARRF